MTFFEPNKDMAKTAANGLHNVLHELSNASQQVEYVRNQHKRDSDEWKSLTMTQLELHFAVPKLVTRMAEYERAANDQSFAKRFWKTHVSN